jgi:hypothetical protein
MIFKEVKKLEFIKKDDDSIKKNKIYFFFWSLQKKIIFFCRLLLYGWITYFWLIIKYILMNGKIDFNMNLVIFFLKRGGIFFFFFFIKYTKNPCHNN